MIHISTPIKFMAFILMIAAYIEITEIIFAPVKTSAAAVP